MDPVVALALPIIRRSEGCFRRAKDGTLRAYADSASPLGRAIQRRGKWNAYLACTWEVPMEMRELSGAPWTIGFGATGLDITANTVWTQAQADQRLVEDTAERARSVQKRATRKLKDCEAAALTSFLFNTGPGQFGRKDGLFELKSARRPSTLWQKAMASDTSGVVLEFAKWTAAQGKKMPGLVVRRKAEADMYRGVA